MSATAENVSDFKKKYDNVFGSAKGGKGSQRDAGDAKAASETEAKSSAATQAVEIVHQTNSVS